MTKILYITSFNKKLFDATGNGFIKSFYENQKDDLFIGTEDNIPQLENYPVKIYQLENDSILQQWTKANIDIIPYYAGGQSRPCDCNFGSQKKHIKYCPWWGWNRNAYRWFRKVITIYYALQTFSSEYDWFFWVDCDCVFTRIIKHERIEKYNKMDVLHLIGTFRNADETGLILFNMNNKGGDFIKKWMKKYTSGSFRKDDRWDDGYQLTMVRRAYPSEFKYYDMAAGIHGRNVAHKSIFGKHIRHHKGIHWRTGIVGRP